MEKKKDRARDKRLKQLGVTVLRFDDFELRYNLEKVIKKIEEWIDEHTKE
jgi:very-short-patch-repair endonuclease